MNRVAKSLGKLHVERLALLGICAALPIAIFGLVYVGVQNYSAIIRQNTLQLYEQNNKLIVSRLGDNISDQQATRRVLQQPEADLIVSNVLITTPEVGVYRVLASTNEQREGTRSQDVVYGNVAREQKSAATHREGGRVSVVAPLFDSSGRVLALIESEYEAGKQLSSLEAVATKSYIAAGLLSIVAAVCLLLVGNSSAVRRYRQELSELKDEHAGAAGAVHSQLRKPLERMHEQLGKLEESEAKQELHEQLREVKEKVVQLEAFFETASMHDEFEQLELSDIVQQLVEKSRARANAKDVHLTYDRPTVPALVRADREALREAVEDILDNAIHFTTKGTVHISHNDTKEHVRLKISDTGNGLKGERMFRPFSREDDMHSGLGLGLWRVKQRIDHMDGAISIDSLPDTGTTCVIELPRAEEG